MKASARGDAAVHLTVALLSCVRNIVGFAVLAGAVGRLLVGLPFAVSALVAAGAAAHALLFWPRRRRTRHAVASAVLWLLDTLFALATGVVFAYLAGFIDSPWGAPTDLPLYGVFSAAAAVAALSAVVSAFASVFAVFGIVRERRANASKELVSLVSSPASDSSLSPAPASGVRTRSESVLFVLALATIVTIFVVGLGLAATSASSLGLALSKSPGCTVDDPGCFEGCEPLGAGGCLLPWPSSFFLVADNTTGTHLHVSVPQTAMPHLRGGGRCDPERINELDGFAITAPALFDLPGAQSLVLDVAGTTSTLLQLDNSTDAASPSLHTAIIDTETLLLVPHWAELDAVEWDTKDERPLVILQPAIPLQYGRRYVAVVRRLYDAMTGAPAPAAPGFAALLRNKSGERWPWLRDSVLPIIQQALGWETEELQLAWDWTTASRQRALGRIEAMREDALSRDISYKVLKVEHHNCKASDATVGRTIIGSVTMSSYLVGGSRRGSLLAARPGEEASIAPTGTITADFVMEIPCSVIAEDVPAWTIQYGHGFFGRATELQHDFMRAMANRHRWILFGAEWRGMSRYDMLFVLKTLLSNPGHISVLGDETMQGHIVFASLMRMVRTQFVNDPAVAQASETGSLIDPSRVAFYGISQGGILGGAYSAISTEIPRAVIGVPGASLAVIFTRSSVWSTFGPPCKLTMFSQRDTRLFISILESLVEPAEVGGWVHDLARKPVLIQSAVGDALVSNLATHILARGINASTIFPQTRPIPFVMERTANFTGNAIVEYNYLDVPPMPIENVAPPPDTDPHRCPRRELTAQEQLRIFIENGGLVVHMCNGTCTLPLVCHPKDDF